MNTVGRNFSTTVLWARYCRFEVWTVGAFEGANSIIDLLQSEDSPARVHGKDEKPSPERQQETRQNHAGEI